MLAKYKAEILFSFVFVLNFLAFYACSEDNEKTGNIPDKKKITNKISVAGKKIFAVKSGIIEYKITGSQTGSKKLYFDDWGSKQAEFSNSTIRVGKYSKYSSLLKITKGDWQYVIDLDDKTGTKRENPLIEKMMDLSQQINYGDFGEQLILIDGGFESGSEIISGKKCKIYTFSKQKKTWWVWNWILLKSEINRGGINISIEAINIEEDARIPENIFSIPPDVLITEIDLEGLRNRERENPVKE